MSAKRPIGLVERRIGVDPIIVGVLIFFVGHMAIRLFGTSNFSVDETMTAIHTQRFHLVYLLPNPPLFDWLYFGLSRVLGTSLLTMQILKTALLSGGAFFLYLAVRPCFRHSAALAAAMASYGATAFYGWEILQLYSHTNALIFAIGFTLWAFMRVIRLQTAVAYILLGVGLGLGILSKYLFGLFFLALVAAALRSPEHRRLLLSWRSLLTLATGTALVSPLLYGLSGAIDQAASAVAGRVAVGGGVWVSLAYLSVQSAQFWLPFAAILWVCLARWPGQAETDDSEGHIVAGDPFEGSYPLLRDATLLMVAAALAAALLLGTKITAGHYLVPVLSLLPMAIFAGLDRRKPFPMTAVRKFLQSAVAVMVAVAVVRLLFFLFASPPFCVPRCVLFVDYTPVMAQLGGSADRQTVILSNELHIASNLLRLVPNARVIVPTDAGGLGAGLVDPDRRSCYFVWFQTYRGSDELAFESALRQLLRRTPTDSELAAIGPIAYVKADWQTKLLSDRGPDTMIGIATIDSASSLCEGNQASERLTAP